MSATAMKVEPIAIHSRPPRSTAWTKGTAFIVCALIGGFATGAAIGVLLWQLV